MTSKRLVNFKIIELSKTIFDDLETERLILREIIESDKPIILAGYSDPRVNQFMSVSYHNLKEVNEQLEWYKSIRLENTGNWWGICLKTTGEMIGNAGFNKWDKKHNNAEIGYWILPPYQGKAYGREAISAIIEFGFSKMRLHRIEAIIEPENLSSIGLTSKLGFLHEGTRRDCEFINGKYVDLEIWAKLNK
jgi:ribosomal-protein-alanine N-acetyltransferase